MSLCIEIASNDDMPCFPNDRDAAPGSCAHVTDTIALQKTFRQFYDTTEFLCSGLCGAGSHRSLPWLQICRRQPAVCNCWHGVQLQKKRKKKKLTQINNIWNLKFSLQLDFVEQFDVDLCCTVPIQKIQMRHADFWSRHPLTTVAGPNLTWFAAPRGTRGSRPHVHCSTSHKCMFLTNAKKLLQ